MVEPVPPAVAEESSSSVDTGSTKDSFLNPNVDTESVVTPEDRSDETVDEKNDSPVT